jgi:hypothetical protein
MAFNEEEYHFSQKAGPEDFLERAREVKWRRYAGQISKGFYSRLLSELYATMILNHSQQMTTIFC